MGIEDDLNLYAYVYNDPMDRSDPNGLYGKGDGWSDDEWKRFSAIQNKARSDVGSKAYELHNKADKLDKEGKSAEAAAVRATADKLTAGAAALASNGSDGKVANLVSGADYAKIPGATPAGAAGVSPSDINKMLVNRDNVSGFLSG